MVSNTNIRLRPSRKYSNFQQCTIEMALRQIIYMSTLVGESELVLGDILKSAVKHNQANGITGMLLYYGGGFMQVLEGEEANLAETYSRICKDPRHHHVISLAETELQQRQFDRWSMGFKHVNASDLAKFPKSDQLFDFRNQPGYIKARPGLALELLTYFSKGMV